MQSHHHTRFSRASTTVFVSVTLIVVVWLVITITKDVPLTLNQSDSAGQTASTTSLTGGSDPAAAHPALQQPVPPQFRLVQAPKGTIRVEIAATDAARERGLSNRTSLSADSGMLFVFPNAGMYGFWMKDMHFPLDMVWIGADQKVSGVLPNVAPGSYPEIFYPPTDILYVLELPAGSAAEHAIATGTLLTI
ncbi:MAG TPA: DUF192 domain-containing protein [Candidatus Paceibacterota bacterium]